MVIRGRREEVERGKKEGGRSGERGRKKANLENLSITAHFY